MKFCKSCGAEMQDNADVCLACGVSTKVNADVVDNGGFLWGLLGFCIPVVGLILFLVWKTDKPVTSKAVGMGALISTCISVVMYIVSIVLAIGVGVM